MDVGNLTCTSSTSDDKMDCKTENLEEIRREFEQEMKTIQERMATLAQNERSSHSKMTFVEEKYKKILEDLQTIENKRIEEGHKSRVNQRTNEENELKIKLVYEGKFKNLYKTMEQMGMQCKIYQAETEIAKEQTRTKIVDLLRMQSKLDELNEVVESKDEALKTAQKEVENTKKAFSEVELELQRFAQMLKDLQLSTNQMRQVNLDLQIKVNQQVRKEEFFNEEIQRLSKCINEQTLELDALKLKKEDEQNQDRDLLLMQLEHEVQSYTEELRRAKETETLLRLQLNKLATIAKVDAESQT